VKSTPFFVLVCLIVLSALLFMLRPVALQQSLPTAHQNSESARSSGPGPVVRDAAGMHAYLAEVSRPYTDALMIMDNGLVDRNSDHSDSAKSTSMRILGRPMRPDELEAIQEYAAAAFKAANGRAPAGWPGFVKWLRFGSAVLYSTSTQYGYLQRYCRLRESLNKTTAKYTATLVCDQRIGSGWPRAQAAFQNLGASAMALKGVVYSYSRFDASVSWLDVVNNSADDVSRWTNMRPGPDPMPGQADNQDSRP